MRVTNWYNWTRFKKRLSFCLFIVGFMMVMSIEKASMIWGYFGVTLGIVATVIIGTIKNNEW